MVDAPSGSNNKTNQYFAREFHVKLAKVDESRGEFFGTIGGVGGINAVVAPTGQLLDGQNALADLANYATFINTANYTADEGTIASVVYQINGVTQTGNTTLSTGDVPSFLVTTSLARSRNYPIETVDPLPIATLSVLTQPTQAAPDADVLMDLTSDIASTVEVVMYLATEATPTAADFNGGGAPTYIDLGTIAATAGSFAVDLVLPTGINDTYKFAFLPENGGDGNVLETDAVAIEISGGAVTLCDFDFDTSDDPANAIYTINGASIFDTINDVAFISLTNDPTFLPNFGTVGTAGMGHNAVGNYDRTVGITILFGAQASAGDSITITVADRWRKFGANTNVDATLRWASAGNDNLGEITPPVTDLGLTDGEVIHDAEYTATAPVGADRIRLRYDPQGLSAWDRGNVRLHRLKIVNNGAA